MNVPAFVPRQSTVLVAALLAISAAPLHAQESASSASPISPEAELELFTKYEADRTRFHELVEQDDIDEAIAFMRQEAEACEAQVRFSRACTSYWFDLALLASSLGLQELEQLAWDRHDRAAPARSVGPPLDIAEAELSDLFSRFLQAMTKRPEDAHRAIVAIGAKLPADSHWWETWPAHFASFYSDNKHYGQAFQWLMRQHRKLQERSSQDPSLENDLHRTRLELATVLNAMERHADAIETLASVDTDSLGGSPWLERFWMASGEALHALGQRARARQAFVMAALIEERAGDANPFGRLCESSLYGTGDWELARAAALRASRKTARQLGSIGDYTARSEEILVKQRRTQICLIWSNWLLAETGD
jgi:hypothetical protein